MVERRNTGRLSRKPKSVRDGRSLVQLSDKAVGQATSTAPRLVAPPSMACSCPRGRATAFVSVSQLENQLQTKLDMQATGAKHGIV